MGRQRSLQPAPECGQGGSALSRSQGHGKPPCGPHGGKTRLEGRCPEWVGCCRWHLTWNVPCDGRIVTTRPSAEAVKSLRACALWAHSRGSSTGCPHTLPLTTGKQEPEEQNSSLGRREGPFLPPGRPPAPPTATLASCALKKGSRSPVGHHCSQFTLLTQKCGRSVGVFIIAFRRQRLPGMM